MATLEATRPAPAPLRREPPPPSVRPPSRPEPPPVGMDALRARWRSAFDAADAALAAARACVPGGELRGRGDRLRSERERTGRLLHTVASDRRGLAAFVLPPLLPPDEARRQLLLPREITACVFSLDGVLVGSAGMHAKAWTRSLDEFLERRPQRSMVPFDPESDYWTYIHGKPRLDGVRAFLASRGISLPLGAPEDEPGAGTVHGLANRKLQLLQRLLAEHGPSAYEDSRRFLELACDAHVHTAVHSSSTHTHEVLERAGLATLIDVRLDGAAIVAERLRARPAPDRILAACKRLGVEPAHTAVFDASIAGIAAARAAGCRLAIGIERSEHRSHADALWAEGADLVALGLGELVASAAR